MVALLTEFVPRTCRSGSLDSSSLATMCRKLSTKGLMLWEWHAISSWSSASMAITTYLQPITGKTAAVRPRLQVLVWLRLDRLITRSDAAPRLCSAARRGTPRSGPASPAPTRRRMSASPCPTY